MAHDLDALLELALLELKGVRTRGELARVLRRHLFRAFEAGVDAQRELALEHLRTHHGVESFPPPQRPRNPSKPNYERLTRELPVTSDLLRLLDEYEKEGDGEVE